MTSHKIETIILTFLTLNKPRPYTSKEISQWINENKNTLRTRTPITPKSVARTIKNNKATMGVCNEVKVTKRGNLIAYYIQEE